MAKDSIGGSLVVGSVVMAISILGAGYYLAKSIDRGTEKLHQLTLALQELPSAEPAAAPSPRAARPSRPDPNRRYEIDVAGAPVKGSEQAVVTIVEWSDFQ